MSSADAATWQHEGYHIASGILSADETARLAGLDITTESRCLDNEKKQLWLSDALIRQIATSPSIHRHLEGFFEGAGFYLWGAQLIDRLPGEAHPWHSDLETFDNASRFVSLWIPVAGASVRNGLRVIGGSHRFGEPLQAHFDWNDPARSDPDARLILEKASAHDRDAVVTRTRCSDGDGVFFDGRTWHGTFNQDDNPRRSILLQYGRHGSPVRRVVDREVFPPVMDRQALPPVLPLSGDADALSNENIFQQDGELVYPRATLARRPQLANQQRRSWVRFPYFETASPVVEQQICHASELLPGCMPHLPHQHDLEEVLIVLDGEATIFSADGDSGVLRSIPAVAGDFFYYPAQHPHTLFNASQQPIHYLMFRWKARIPADVAAPSYHFRHAEYAGGNERFAVDRPSSGLGHLHTHFSRLQPGQAFPTHIDQYDTAIVVLEGVLSMLDEELGPGGVFYVRAGELHNTRNEGREVCEYLVFELHARTGPADASFR